MQPLPLSKEQVDALFPRPSWDQRPFLVIWEVTRRCALACRHCRASAHPQRDSGELSTQQGKKLLADIARLKPMILVLTGGDPALRRDLFELVEFGIQELDLHIALSPSATPALLRLPLDQFYQVGVRRISLSLDGATQSSHDTFRGVKGTWDWTMAAIAQARDAGVEVQINTTLTHTSGSEFAAMADLMHRLEPTLWNLFMLVPTGRGHNETGLNPHATEKILHELAALQQTAPFALKTTEAPQFRRIAMQRWREKGGTRFPASLGVGDGKGFVFVSHHGEIYPSGFLPIPCGQFPEISLIDVYRNHSVFRQLRNPDLLKGKCGRCEFRSICGGSRARAFAVHNDFLAEEPTCPYQPQGLHA
jgi:radical SAM protein with 4Fe4S-binding SPASM domain